MAKSQLPLKSFKNIAGQRFGRLVAIEPAGSLSGGGVTWRCVCDCSKETITSGAFLRTGRTTSCGCARTVPQVYKTRIDLSGQTFFRLTVVERGPSRENSAAQWYCRCVCGETKLVRAASLRNGTTQSCGCLHREVICQREDLSGLIFGHLVVVRYVVKSAREGGSGWLCRCECGNETHVKSSSLQSGKTRSCGCLIGKTARNTFTKHGRSKSNEYAIWVGIIARCTNPRCKAYPDYGGRGIRMCTSWRENFEKFLADVGPRPSPDRTLDRIDVNGNYEPGNCRWATRKEQAANKRKMARIELFTTQELRAELARRELVGRQDEKPRPRTLADRGSALL